MICEGPWGGGEGGGGDLRRRGVEMKEEGGGKGLRGREEKNGG